jgi:hypothetical protein
VRYTAADFRHEWRNWSWPENLAAESIFLLELRAAIDGIKANAVADGVLIIILDNTAAAAVLRAFYSSTAKGRELVADLHSFLTRLNVFLLVAGIAGVDNDADSPTRGDMEKPNWCDKRLMATWETGVRALTGCERLRLNPVARQIGREDQRKGAIENEEDVSCEALTSAIDGLMRDTSLA